MKLKNKYSFAALLAVSILLLFYRVSYSDLAGDKPIKVTTWDAFGYYMYAPSVFIYGDVSELKWLPEIDSTYNVTGGDLYQANIHDNGNYVNKYLGGVSIMQLPFFFVGHLIAVCSNYKADGFSPPYQYAIAFGAIIYCILALMLLRSLLLRYFRDDTVAITLLLLVAATNLIQYVSIDSAQSHAYIFPLYVLIFYTTIKWHEVPSAKWALLSGIIIGLATISRPTEAIMLFIPLLWNTHTKEAKQLKWQQVKAHRTHIWMAVLGGLIGILPQLIYWKITSGSFIYDVGSKWFFLNPWFRVLFGFTNGWFIYTPITVFFIVGFFFMRNQPFRRAVIVFSLLNIWIIIAWSDWKYGATYSTRALTQGYPVMAFALAGFIEYIRNVRWKYVFYVLGAYLIFVNNFQIGQYNKTILHYNEMNAAYYASIYLDSNPTPLDMSLLDTDEVLWNTEGYTKTILFESSAPIEISNQEPYPDIITALAPCNKGEESWLKIELSVKANEGFRSSFIQARTVLGEEAKDVLIRLASPISNEGEANSYAFFVDISSFKEPSTFHLLVNSHTHFSGLVDKVLITQYSR